AGGGSLAERWLRQIPAWRGSLLPVPRAPTDAFRSNEESSKELDRPRFTVAAAGARWSGTCAGGGEELAACAL
ncbi:hypothetical protein ACVXG7_27790, partial [Enterobacter hormaechei]